MSSTTQPKPFEIGDKVKTDDGIQGTIASLYAKAGPEFEGVRQRVPWVSIQGRGGAVYHYAEAQLAHVSTHHLDWEDDELIELWQTTPQRKGHSRPLDYARRVLKGKPVA